MFKAFCNIIFTVSMCIQTSNLLRPKISKDRRNKKFSQKATFIYSEIWKIIRIHLVQPGGKEVQGELPCSLLLRLQTWGFFQKTSHKTKLHGPKNCQGRFIFDYKNNFFTKRVVRHQNRVHRIESPSPEVFETCRCDTWGHCGFGNAGLMFGILEGFFNLINSVIPRFPRFQHEVTVL